MQKKTLTVIAAGLVVAVGLAGSFSLPGPAQAKTKMVYTKHSTPIFDGPNGKILGSLPPGTPIELVQSGPKRSKVALEGWSEQYHDLQVYADVGLRMERGTFVRFSDASRAVLGSKTDAWKTKWTQVKVTGWVDTKSYTDRIKAVWDSARDLYEERCMDCHEYRPPELLNPAQWRGTLVVMSHRAALTPEESALLRQYFQAHAADE